ncbi:unnamed protein product [Cuscuta campestris]|uniref:Uncharacterized protein n=1 Tax=Cuscuta campestris TaxID=132261 RepID=A0A484NNF8_9ASTE|nr:unnamed protein product [Cuscuta campestris]
MFTGMVNNGETIRQSWMKHDREDVAAEQWGQNRTTVGMQRDATEGGGGSGVMESRLSPKPTLITPKFSQWRGLRPPLALARGQ